MTAKTGTVFTGVLRSQRRSLILWAGAIAAVAAMYTAFYPSVGGMKMEIITESLPPELVTALGFDTLASAAGYVSSTVYSLLGPILVLVCAIGLGARLVAGQEEDGVLELEYTAPVSRGRVYVERLAALWTQVLVLVLAVSVVLLLMSAALDLDLSPGNILAAGSALLLFGGALGTLALAVGAATGRRGVVLGAASGVAVLGYLLSYLAPLAEVPWMEAVSPFHWYAGAKPLVNGFDWGGIGLLAALAVVAAVVGARALVRRDLMV